MNMKKTKWKNKYNELVTKTIENFDVWKWRCRIWKGLTIVFIATTILFAILYAASVML